MGKSQTGPTYLFEEVFTIRKIIEHCLGCANTFFAQRSPFPLLPEYDKLSREPKGWAFPLHGHRRLLNKKLSVAWPSHSQHLGV